MNCQIRAEQPEEFPRIKEILDLAFQQEEEGQIVERIRASDAYVPELSLVAIWEKEIIGHIVFSEIKIENEKNSYRALALAPMAVHPDFQRKGIGNQLIKSGLEVARQLGRDRVIVLGHAEYYPKFGFLPASKWNIKAPFPVPDEVFMALALKNGGLDNVEGTVIYSKAFGI